MALKPTIFKFKISLSDLNRHHYDTLNLTVAQHPSETGERMMVRVLAFCLNAQEHLTFTQGLSAIDEPDIWLHTLGGELALWIDVGEPAKIVKVYSFNSKSNAWWSQVEDQFNKLPVSVYQFEWQQVQALAALLERTMGLSITITGDSAYVATTAGECELDWVALR